MVQKKSEKQTPERAKLEDTEKLILEIAKKEKNPAKIGIILKEKYGIYKVSTLGKKICQVLKENNIEYNDDLTQVNKKLKKIEEHYNKNKQDKRAKREIVRFVGLRKKLQKHKAKKQ